MDTTRGSAANVKIMSLADILLQLAHIIRQNQSDINDKSLKEYQKLFFRQRVLSHFTCHQNIDIIHFLTEKAVDYERHHISRTFFFVNEQGDWLGFFVLSLRVLDMRDWDKKVKKQFLCSGKSPNNVQFIPTYLIAQLARNDHFSNEINGRIMMNAVLKQLDETRRILGGKIVWLDSVNHEKVIQFYEQFGFRKVGQPIGTQKLQPMFLTFTE